MWQRLCHVTRQTWLTRGPQDTYRDEGNFSGCFRRSQAEHVDLFHGRFALGADLMCNRGFQRLKGAVRSGACVRLLSCDQDRTSSRYSFVLEFWLISSWVRSAHCSSDKVFCIFEALRLSIKKHISKLCSSLHFFHNLCARKRERHTRFEEQRQQQRRSRLPDVPHTPLQSP